VSPQLVEFGYTIEPRDGLVYFVTNYASIESLVQHLPNLTELRLYVVGCDNITVDAARLQSNLFDYLPRLTHFHFFVQSYAGRRITTMDSLGHCRWRLATYTDESTDMHFLFTIPFGFARLDQCLNEKFVAATRTSPTDDRSSAGARLERQHPADELGMSRVTHVDLSCDLTDRLLVLVRDRFSSLASIRICSSNARYALRSSTVNCTSHRSVHSVRSVSFAGNCSHLVGLVQFLPNLQRLTIDQPALTRLLDENVASTWPRLSHLSVSRFQQRHFRQLLNAFCQLRSLLVRTVSAEDEGPLRSFVDGQCLHKARPLFIFDLLDELFEQPRHRLQQLQVGCIFERDEPNLHAMLAAHVRRALPSSMRFHIRCEPWTSTRCGTVNITFV
jgi:hypothetical protein